MAKGLQPSSHADHTTYPWEIRRMATDESSIALKTCTKCQESKPETAFPFHRRPENPNGREAQCKLCFNAHKRQIYRRNPAVSAAKMRKYRAEHPEIIQRIERKRAIKHREIRNAIRRMHPERNRKNRRQWAQNNQLKIKTLKHIDGYKRRALLAQLPVTLTIDHVQFMHQYFAHSCAVCGNQEGFTWTLALDHWIPISSPDCPGTVPSNVILLCHGEGGCNNSKGDMEASAWLLRRYGKRKANNILTKIQAYFSIVESRDSYKP